MKKAEKITTEQLIESLNEKVKKNSPLNEVDFNSEIDQNYNIIMGDDSQTIDIDDSENNNNI